MIPTHQVSDDHADAASASERQTAVLHDLRTPFPVAVIRQDNYLRLVRRRDQIHSTAHACDISFARDYRLRDSPLTSFPGIIQFAKSPAALTSIA